MFLISVLFDFLTLSVALSPSPIEDINLKSSYILYSYNNDVPNYNVKGVAHSHEPPENYHLNQIL